MEARDILSRPSCCGVSELGADLVVLRTLSNRWASALPRDQLGAPAPIRAASRTVVLPQPLGPANTTSPLG